LVGLPLSDDVLQTQTPDFIRMPTPGEVDPRTGLNRSIIDLLVRPQERNEYRPPVKSRLLKQRGQRLIRLVDYQSLLDYLHGLPDGADPANIVASNANRAKAETALAAAAK
jgi:hypothetical protein